MVKRPAPPPRRVFPVSRPERSANSEWRLIQFSVHYWKISPSLPFNAELDYSTNRCCDFFYEVFHLRSNETICLYNIRSLQRTRRAPKLGRQLWRELFWRQMWFKPGLPGVFSPAATHADRLTQQNNKEPPINNIRDPWIHFCKLWVWF